MAMFVYPRRSRSSTRVDSPPPTSMMEAERASAARSIKARDVSKCSRYQLTASGVVVVYRLSQCDFVSIGARYAQQFTTQLAWEVCESRHLVTFARAAL